MTFWNRAKWKTPGCAVLLGGCTEPSKVEGMCQGGNTLVRMVCRYSAPSMGVRTEVAMRSGLFGCAADARQPNGHVSSTCCPGGASPPLLAIASVAAGLAHMDGPWTGDKPIRAHHVQTNGHTIVCMLGEACCTALAGWMPPTCIMLHQMTGASSAHECGLLCAAMRSQPSVLQAACCSSCNSRNSGDEGLRQTPDSPPPAILGSLWSALCSLNANYNETPDRTQQTELVL